jgi:hypothetical protein
MRGGCWLTDMFKSTPSKSKSEYKNTQEDIERERKAAQAKAKLEVQGLLGRGKRWYINALDPLERDILLSSVQPEVFKKWLDGTANFNEGEIMRNEFQKIFQKRAANKAAANKAAANKAAANKAAANQAAANQAAANKAVANKAAANKAAANQAAANKAAANKAAANKAAANKAAANQAAANKAAANQAAANKAAAAPMNNYKNLKILKNSFIYSNANKEPLRRSLRTNRRPPNYLRY